MLRRTLPNRNLAAALLACSLAAGLGAAPAEGTNVKSTRKSYDLPVGDAAHTLGQFATASGRQLIFLIDRVKGERTNAVRGEFSAEEALLRMLAGTRLVVSQDPATGAYVVGRRRPGEADRAPPPEPGPSPCAAAPAAADDLQTLSMAPVSSPSNNHQRGRLALLSAWILAAVSGSAQSNAPTPAEETIVLSPFEVVSDTGDKYGTTKSNSVTMFQTDSSKLPVSADIMTSQFMSDLGITDMEMLVANMATGGGFGSIQSGDDALPKQPGDRVANTEIKLRGIGAGGIRRDGLIASNNSSFNDSFATEGIEILKGPNALLYAGAAGGGVIASQSKQARFGSHFGTVSLRLDSYASKRGEFDYGTSARTGWKWLPDIAVRLVGMKQEQRLFRHGFGNKADGEYIQVALRMPRSTLRISFKHDEALFWQGWMPNLVYDTSVAQTGTTYGYNRAYTPPVDLLAKHKLATDGNYPTLSLQQLWADGAAPEILGGRTLTWRNLDAGFNSDYNHNPIDNYLLAKWETRLTDHISAIVTAAFDRNSVFMQYTPAGVLLAPGTTVQGNVGGNNNTSGLLNPVAYDPATPLADYTQFVTATTTDWTIMQQNFPDQFYEQLFRRQAFRAAIGAEWTNFNRRLKHQFVAGYDWSALKANYRYSNYYMADKDWNILYDPTWTDPANTKTGLKQHSGRYVYQNHWYTIGSGRLEFDRVNPLTTKRFTSANGQNWVLAPVNGEGSFPITDTNPHGLKPVSGTYSAGGRLGGDAYARTTDGATFAAIQTDWFDDRVQTLASVRRDSFGLTRWDYQAPIDVTRQDPFTAYSVGANVRATDTLRPYANLSKSATPPNANATYDPLGNPSPVEKSTGWETGFKFSALRGRIDGSFSYYSVKTLGKNTSASTMTGSINPTGLNGTAPISGQTWVGVDQTSNGFELMLSGQVARGWRTAFRASTQDGRVLNSLVYPQYYNDQFNVNAAGQVTYANGTPVYVNPTAGSPTAVASTAAGATPLTLAMLNNPANSVYYWDPHPQNGTTQNSSLGNLLKGSGGGSNNAAFGTPVNGDIITHVTGLPASARQIEWDDPYGNAANGVAAALKGRYTIGYPRYKLSLTNTYDFQSGALKGFSIGGQLNFDLQQRNRYITWPTEYTVVTTTTNANGSKTITTSSSITPPTTPFPTEPGVTRQLRITQTTAASTNSAAAIREAAEANGLDLPGRWYYTDSGLLWGLPDNYVLHAWIKYTRAFSWGGSRKYRFTSQINVNNVFNHAPLLRAPASGTNIFGEWRGLVQMNQPRSFAWTNSISF